MCPCKVSIGNLVYIGVWGSRMLHPRLNDFELLRTCQAPVVAPVVAESSLWIRTHLLCKCSLLASGPRCPRQFKAMSFSTEQHIQLAPLICMFTGLNALVYLLMSLNRYSSIYGFLSTCLSTYPSISLSLDMYNLCAACMSAHRCTGMSYKRMRCKSIQGKNT